MLWHILSVAKDILHVVINLSVCSKSYMIITFLSLSSVKLWCVIPPK